MNSIQGSINSMVGSASRAIMAVKGYQALQTKKAEQAEKAQAKQTAQAQKQAGIASKQQLAAQRAKQSARDAIEAKKTQRRSFMEYLAKQPSSLGKIGDLDPQLQKKIAKQYTPAMRRKLMDAADKEVKNGKHK